MNTIEPTSPLVVTAVSREKRNCLCCGKQFEVESFIIKDFCDRCYLIVCKEVFDESNGKLTCKQLRDKIKRRVNR